MRHSVETAVHDLGHLVGAHALLGHPVQRLRTGPVAAQADLQETVAPHRTGLDEPAHRLAVTDERAELDVAGVGVRVEVDDADPPPPAGARDRGRVRPGDRVVSAEDERDRAAARDRSDRGLEVPARSLGVAGVDLDVARVEHPHVLEAVDTHGEGRAGAVVGVVVGAADRLRTEARTRAVRRASVERGTDDHDVGVGVGLRLVDRAAVDAEERDVGSEHRSVAGHVRSLPWRRRRRGSVGRTRR